MTLPAGKGLRTAVALSTASCSLLGWAVELHRQVFFESLVMFKKCLMAHVHVRKRKRQRLFHRVKQVVQAMEICRRPKANIYDNLNQQNMVNFLPSSTAAGNITLTFNNHLNSLTSQVGILKRQRAECALPTGWRRGGARCSGS